MEAQHPVVGHRDCMWVLQAINTALKEDTKVGGAFLLSLPGLLLCAAGIHYTPARIFFCT